MQASMRGAKAFVAALAIAATIPGTAWAASDGKNRKVVVENYTSVTLRELYASPVSSDTWEEDLLGQRTLGPGETIEADIDNGTEECFYDLKAVLSNEKTVEQRNVNVCEVSAWTIGDSGNSIR
ncbi:hypothetical protein KK137_11650 [Croceibacterium sp. LX-88]|jgi:hypothetical protein|uniref:Uncharacterized protein n=1 Tax=Croceibacterium selenioxidans TaxID=2838833 RepID=A0ABS5W5M5_9SPHN|nr:hypothetical protein [Croceibacterium selenioxidans]MBT2134989.1 hypothetical protein [Croceibacterium selenioxidans]